VTDRELMQKALEALELLAKYENPLTKIQVRKPRDGGSIVTVYPHQVATDAAEPLRERLAQPQRTHWDGCEAVHPECKQPEQEPVAHTLNERLAQPEPVIDKSAAIRIATALGWEPRREWVGLTDEECIAAIDEDFNFALDHGNVSDRSVIRYARAIEAKLKEKNA